MEDQGGTIFLENSLWQNFGGLSEGEEKETGEQGKKNPQYACTRGYSILCSDQKDDILKNTFFENWNPNQKLSFMNPTLYEMFVYSHFYLLEIGNIQEMDNVKTFISHVGIDLSVKWNFWLNTLRGLYIKNNEK